MKSESHEHVVQHDKFNVVVLSVIVGITCYYLAMVTEWNKLGTAELGVGYENIFYVLFYVFNSYLLVDVIWILLRPTAVMSSPSSLIVHHVVTFLLTLTPFLVPQFQFHLGTCLLVEMNTIFLTLRRLAVRGTISHRLFDIMFYITWVVLRLIMFPVLFVFYSFEYLRYCTEVGTRINVALFAPILLLALTVMSYKWTVDLLSKKKHS